MSNILVVKNLVKEFDLTKKFFEKFVFEKGKIVRKHRVVHAVNKVSFNIEEGEVLGLVGESGCGKSTVARTIMRLYKPNNGTICFNDEQIESYSRKEMLDIRKEIQMIFQDPYASLNPRYRVKDIISEPMLFHKIAKTKKEAYEKTIELMEKVGLRAEQADRYPHQFSGGQRQRIGIARALAVKPKLIIADEPVSALDVSIQAQIINLLIDLKEEFGLSYLFIAHDLSVVNHISDRIGVMYLGKIVEKANKKSLFDNPLHPYTKLLLSSIPLIEEEKLVESQQIKGEIPSPIDLPKGCFFNDRCPYSKLVCKERQPIEVEVEENHYVSCHLYARQVR